MMTTMLVPLDGSATAAQILPYVRVLARAMQASIQLVSVVTHADQYHVVLNRGAWEEMSGDRSIRDPETIDELTDLRNHTLAYLEGQADILRAEGFSVGMDVLEGHAAEAIVAAAAEADLIAMATHGYSGVRRWAVGSVTDRVLHTSPVPVFVARALPTHDYAIRRILVPLDGSALARRALAPAVELARTIGAALELLTVVPPPISGIEPAITPIVLTSDDVVAMRDRLMGELIEVAGFNHGLAVDLRIVQGFVAEEISDEAERREVDLIVMASHGYGGWRRLALGSVADKVLHATKTPLLIVHVNE
ncbi:MAG: universal stress protein [Roseiflexaceae bacterium]